MIKGNIGQWYDKRKRPVWHGLDFYPHDANVTISLLFHQILSYKNNRPPILILHMDNCAKENKNKYVFSWISTLIAFGWFNTVEVYFLPTGHIHEKNDACFILISNALKTYNCITPDDFINIFILKAYNCVTEKPNVKSIYNIYNWKDWITPYLNNLKSHFFIEVSYFDEMLQMML